MRSNEGAGAFGIAGGALAERDSARYCSKRRFAGRSYACIARVEVRGKPDCSHLVHQIYRFTGFEYPYASSFDLYEGSDNFVRVKTPQPGGLIAWQGHIGIVIDPTERSFYSSVRSGLRADYYDTAYWRARVTAFLSLRSGKRRRAHFGGGSASTSLRPDAGTDHHGAHC